VNQRMGLRELTIGRSASSGRLEVLREHSWVVFNSCLCSYARLL
jgi:hypothetical protein